MQWKHCLGNVRTWGHSSTRLVTRLVIVPLEISKDKVSEASISHCRLLSIVWKSWACIVWKCTEWSYSHNHPFQWWHGSALSLVWLWTLICTSTRVPVPALPLLQSVPYPHSWSWCSCQSGLWGLTERDRKVVERQEGGYCSHGSRMLLPNHLSAENNGQPIPPTRNLRQFQVLTLPNLPARSCGHKQSFCQVVEMLCQNTLPGH